MRRQRARFQSRKQKIKTAALITCPKISISACDEGETMAVVRGTFRGGFGNKCILSKTLDLKLLIFYQLFSGVALTRPNCNSNAVVKTLLKLQFLTIE